MAPADPHRHPSQEVDTERVRKDAVKDYIIGQLVETMDTVKTSLGDMKDRLVHGGIQMDSMEKDIKQLQLDFKAHCAEETKTKQETRAKWAGIGPTIIASVSSGLITASLIGGIVLYFTKK